MSLREKLQTKYRRFGDRPPGWAQGDLGRASTAPGSLLSGLGVSNFRGGGEDGLHDIYLLIERAVRSSILTGMYSTPVKRERSGEIELNAASDLYTFGRGAVMLRFIKAILAAADSTGIVALPSQLSVEPNVSRTGVIISWPGFVNR